MALLAILFSVLVPSISHALTSGTGSPGLAEICTVDGVRLVPVAGTDPAPDNGGFAAHGLQHCPYCATDAGSFALLPPSAVGFAILGGHDEYPSLFSDAPYPLFCWNAANARAPPSPA
jgi:hypothetical protein